MAVTLSDVAKAAGVSQATASRAIHGATGRRVRPELQAKVLKAAQDLKYSADANAQAMARGKTTAIGLLVHDITDPYFSSIASGVAHAAEEHGLVVTLATTDRRYVNEINFIKLMQSQRARAIILAGGRYDNEEENTKVASALAEYRRRGGQTAVIGQEVLDSATVKIANFEGTAQLAASLSARGYKRFAILAGPKSHLTAQERTAGFSQSARKNGSTIRPEHVVHAEFTWEGGYEAMLTLIKNNAVGTAQAAGPLGNQAQAVFAVTDVMALGAMAAIRDAGLVVGTDVALAGFNDISTLRDVSPRLTSVTLPLEEIGRSALQLALQGETKAKATADTPQSPANTVEISGTVVLRESTPVLN